MKMSHSQVLELSTKAYYWKPMTAFFRSIEMEKYFNSGIVFNDPALDLGCGDGGILRMLREGGLVEKLLFGMDISYGELKKAQVAKEHMILFQADANNLPFKDDRFSSIICNGVLCSIPGGVDQSLAEVNRVLKAEGIFVGTVPTDKFVEALILPKILNKLSKRLSLLYTEKLNSRLPHFNTYSPQEWKKRFEYNGLSMIKNEAFFFSKAGFVWNIFSMQVFRLFGILKFIKNQHIINFISKKLKNIFMKLYTEGERQGGDFGYLFIVAQKNDLKSR